MRQLQFGINQTYENVFQYTNQILENQKSFIWQKTLNINTNIYIASVSETNKEPILFESFNSLLLQCPIRSRHETMFFP
jgi:hypothetical protein